MKFTINNENIIQNTVKFIKENKLKSLDNIPVKKDDNNIWMKLAKTIGSATFSNAYNLHKRWQRSIDYRNKVLAELERLVIFSKKRGKNIPRPIFFWVGLSYLLVLSYV